MSGIRSPASPCPAPRWIACAIALLLSCGGGARSVAAAGSADSLPGSKPQASLGPGLKRPPLDPPLVITGGFGDYRVGHFHAGFDLSTGGRVGRAVHAPESGWIERVRSSGAGYGRSLYLRTSDGRTLQLGHLDAFAEPLAGYVRRAQESSGQYEQDLWPSPNEFPVHAGDVLAWSGESGAGGPHLHFEIRRGDFALHPQRAGLAVPEARPPGLPRLTLEPLDDSSSVAGGSGPYTFAPGRADTVRAVGRLRAIVDARGGTWRGVDRRVPWSAGLEWAGRRTECRFDSVSWATDMREGDYVHDAGRVIGEKGLVLWAPSGFRPRVLHADAPPDEDAGTILVRPGEPPRTLHLWALDANGKTIRRSVVLRPGAAPHAASAGWWSGETPWSGGAVDIVSLPGGFLRWSVPASRAPGGVELQVGPVSRRATRTGDRWSATFALPGTERGKVAPLALAMRGTAPGATGQERGGVVRAMRVSPADSSELSDETGRFRVRIPVGALFEDALVFAYPGSASGEKGLIPVGASWSVEPATLPLRLPVQLRLELPPGESADRVGLCRGDSRGWQWIGATIDSVSRVAIGESRELGRFALLRDDLAPRVVLLGPAPPSGGRPYSRWAVEASVVEEGSGVDARASWLEVDGVRVPTEWDPEAGRLRWRPVRPAKPGLHRVVIVATDRAGNVARGSGSFRVKP